MARTSHANILSLNDSAQSWNFDLFFPTIPGGGDSQKMTYKCKTTELPTSTIETVKIELHGVAKQEAGRATYDHSFNSTFMETVDYATYMTFRRWRDYMRSWKNNSGTNAGAYKVNMELDVYDNAGNVAQTMIMAGAFPTAINTVNFSGSESTAIEMSISWSFDYVDDGTSY